MPIRQGGAKLWFKTQQEIDEYDDRMIASIELKSQDFNDENFSPVFTRLHKQFVLKPGEKFHKDIAKLNKPYESMKQSEMLEKFYGGKHNNTHWRQWPIEKFLAGWGLGYLIFREIPIRNFYTRCFVMFGLVSKILDIWAAPMFGTPINFSIKWDQWLAKNTRNYNAVHMASCRMVPTSSNQIHEGIQWRWRQPAFMKNTDYMFIGTFFPLMLGLKKANPVGWDGTWNMPLERLADPMHKDCMAVKFMG